jgi:hypothetical protein
VLRLLRCQRLPYLSMRKWSPLTLGSDCRSKMKDKICAECQEKFDKKMSRCLDLERSAAAIEVKCRRGCRGSFAYSKLAEHDEDCVGKAQISCTKCQCNKSKLWSSAIKHHKSVSTAIQSFTSTSIFSSFTHTGLSAITFLLTVLEWRTWRHQND